MSRINRETKKKKFTGPTENEDDEEDSYEMEEESGKEEEEEEDEEFDEGDEEGEREKGGVTEEGPLDDEEEEGDEEEEECEDEEEEEGDSDRYEEDVEDEKAVEARRRKLPKSALDDKFFNLAEMEAFLDAQDKAEEAGRKTDRNLGKFDTAEEMDAIIRSYEEENLETRNWALQGEAVANERGKDELLEHFVDVDYRSTAPPTITEEKTAHLEAVIKKRIKEKLFDDVVRKFRENEALIPVYRNQTDIEQTVRKSLAEVYEEKFEQELNGGGEGTSQAKPELDPKVAAIQKDMDSLFLKLDALSHFQFRPQPVREEVKIVNNMPSLHMEEVGPMAAVEPDENLLAPEEVMRRAKRAIKAADERTETDRKRERRQKKKKQRILASIGAMKGKKGEAEEGGEKQKKRGEKRARSGRKLDFAGGMQALVSGEAEDKEGKKRARKRTRREGGGGSIETN